MPALLVKGEDLCFSCGRGGGFRLKANGRSEGAKRGNGSTLFLGKEKGDHDSCRLWERRGFLYHPEGEVGFLR